MNKSKFFMAVITMGISAIILFVIVYYTFNNNKINQGDFRISDSILSSIVEFEDKSEGANEWKYDISQNNKISMLIQTIGDTNIKEIYLENVKVKSKNNVNIYIEQNKYDVSYKYEDVKNENINIYVDKMDTGDYLVDFDIKNEDILSGYSRPEGVNELRHDGTVLNTASIAISQIRFQIKYNLVILQDNEKTNKCKIELEMPDEKIAVDGFYVQRLDSANYNFKTSY